MGGGMGAEFQDRRLKPLGHPSATYGTLSFVPRDVKACLVLALRGEIRKTIMLLPHTTFRRKNKDTFFLLRMIIPFFAILVNLWEIIHMQNTRNSKRSFWSN